MSSKRYPAEFCAEAIRQVTEWGFTVSKVAGRLGVSTNSLYKWLKGVSKTSRLVAQDDLHAENARLKAELKRIEEERDILKGRRVLCQGIRARYAFMVAHRREFRLTTMCRFLRMHRSGFYARMKMPQSQRVHRDLLEDGERCGEHQVALLMRIHCLRAIRGY